MLEASGFKLPSSTNRYAYETSGLKRPHSIPTRKSFATPMDRARPTPSARSSHASKSRGEMMLEATGVKRAQNIPTERPHNNVTRVLSFATAVKAPPPSRSPPSNDDKLKVAERPSMKIPTNEDDRSKKLDVPQLELDPVFGKLTGKIKVKGNKSGPHIRAARKLQEKKNGKMNSPLVSQPVKPFMTNKKGSRNNKDGRMSVLKKVRGGVNSCIKTTKKRKYTSVEKKKRGEAMCSSKRDSHTGSNKSKKARCNKKV